MAISDGKQAKDKPPIVVELTEVENQGHNLAGNAPDDGIENQIVLILTTGGMEGPTAEFMAKKLATGAISARAKIAAATRYEIKVLTLPKTSTLLPKRKSKKSKTAVT